MDSSDENDAQCTPPHVTESAKNIVSNLLPEKSKNKYEREYDIFMDWCKTNKFGSISENVLLAYFAEISKNKKSSTMWSIYSMLKTTLSVKDDVDITKYRKVIAFLKNKSVGYKAKKSRIFKRNEICKFLTDAPDESFLMLKDPSTSSHLYSENDIDTSSVKSENVLDEDDYDSEVVDTKVMLDITDTQILLDDVENLRVEVNPKYPTHKECDLFGEYVAKHLQQLPLEVASELKFRIQTLMTETLLEYIQQHPPEAPPVVKLESPAEEDVPIRTRNIETQTNQTMDDERPQACTAKIPRNTDSPVAKRLKLDNLSSETQISSSKKQPKRTEWTRFAENIALQLEQLPEEVSLQLQSDIYDLISHVLPNPADEDSPNRVKIKDEIIEGTPTEIVDYQS